MNTPGAHATKQLISQRDETVYGYVSIKGCVVVYLYQQEFPLSILETTDQPSQIRYVFSTALH